MAVKLPSDNVDVTAMPETEREAIDVFASDLEIDVLYRAFPARTCRTVEAIGTLLDVVTDARNVANRLS